MNLKLALVFGSSLSVLMCHCASSEDPNGDSESAQTTRRRTPEVVAPEAAKKDPASTGTGATPAKPTKPEASTTPEVAPKPAASLAFTCKGTADDDQTWSDAWNVRYNDIAVDGKTGSMQVFGIRSGLEAGIEDWGVITMTAKAGSSSRIYSSSDARITVTFDAKRANAVVTHKAKVGDAEPAATATLTCVPTT